MSIFDKIIDFGASRGGGAILGGIASGLFGKSQAQSQMNFQERMSGTAHQRQVKDLRAAGLNPILSATGGSGASTPGGAMTSIDPVSSALATRKLSQELKNMKALEEKTKEETEGVRLDNRGLKKARSDFFNEINPWSIKQRYDETHPTSAKGLSRAKRAQMTPKLDKVFKRTQKYKESVDTDINP